jgi:hypothetical protein
VAPVAGRLETYSAKMTYFGTSAMLRLDEDRQLEGLRVPPRLENCASVNFVLTQEPGKLKPKDLKAAIERNRAEREDRALEQDKLREEGGGAGMLDLRGILAEERLNASEGDPFKRQLREMAFLADGKNGICFICFKGLLLLYTMYTTYYYYYILIHILIHIHIVDDVDKLEVEKGFRVSEDYLGSSLLSSEDVEVSVYVYVCVCVCVYVYVCVCVCMYVCVCVQSAV